MLELVPTVLKEVIDVIFRHMIYIYIMYYSTAALVTLVVRLRVLLVVPCASPRVWHWRADEIPTRVVGTPWRDTEDSRQLQCM
jgi:hypothetical protein